MGLNPEEILKTDLGICSVCTEANKCIQVPLHDDNRTILICRSCIMTIEIEAKHLLDYQSGF